MVVFGDVSVRQFSDRNSFCIGLGNHLVIDIREVLDKNDTHPFVFQIFSERIECDERPCVPDVKKVIDGGSAGIDPDLAFDQRYEFLFLSCQCVIKPHLVPRVFIDYRLCIFF